MGIFYIVTVLLMLVGFVLYKKSEKRINLISLCILVIIAYLAFNIFVCMLFGNLGITLINCKCSNSNWIWNKNLQR